MTYRVIYAPSFIQDVRDQIYYFQRERVADTTTEKWFNELFALIDSLEQWPLRYPVDEFQSLAAGQETRKVNAGDYLVFYQVDEEHRQVHVVAFMHGARGRDSEI